MDISLSVDSDAFILRQFFTPWFATETVDSPIVAVKAAPQDGTTVLIHILLRCHRIIEALNMKKSIDPELYRIANEISI